MSRSLSFEIIFQKELKHSDPLPINSLVFSEDAKYLISGGDDEAAHVWDMETFERRQTLSDSGWGQITTLILIYPESLEDAVLLSVGSGRGCLTLIPMIGGKDKPFLRQKAVIFSPFPFNDAVELQAYDRTHSRLAVASHSGELKVFLLEKLSLKLLWSSSFESALPGGIFFHGNVNQHILTLGLETGEMCCRDAASGDVLWSKSLKGAVGGAALSDDHQRLLVNNLSTGVFDLYRLADVASLQSLPIPLKRRFTVQCQFLEAAHLAVCGSDSNRLHVVDVSTNKVIEALLTGQESDMTQTVAVTFPGASRIFIAGASGGSVFVYEKTEITENLLDQSPDRRERAVNVSPAVRNDTGYIFLAIMVLTYNSWSPSFFNVLSVIFEYCNRMFLAMGQN